MPLCRRLNLPDETDPQRPRAAVERRAQQHFAHPWLWRPEARDGMVYSARQQGLDVTSDDICHFSHAIPDFAQDFIGRIRLQSQKPVGQLLGDFSLQLTTHNPRQPPENRTEEANV